MRTDLMLTATDLSIGYRNDRHTRTVQQGLSFSLRSGELTCLLGTNGSGKSTLLRTIARSLPPLGGELCLAGKPIGCFGNRLFSQTVGVVLTEKGAAGGLTVRELVALGRHPHTGFFGRLDAEDREIVESALSAVGMERKAERLIAQLSDGERQKAFIAKSLAQECPVVLLDEPTAFLDVVSRIEMMNLLHDLAVKQQKTILLSTHDLEQALSVADEVVVFYAGETIEKAKAELAEIERRNELARQRIQREEQQRAAQVEEAKQKMIAQIREEGERREAELRAQLHSARKEKKQHLKRC